MLWQDGKEHLPKPKTLFKEETLEMFLLRSEASDRRLLLLTPDRIAPSHLNVTWS